MRKGFTLIEIMVVIAITAVIMTIIMAIMANTFKASNRTKAMQKINENGSYAMEQIKRYYLSQSVCDAGLLTVGADNILKLNTTPVNALTKSEVIASDFSAACDVDLKVLSVGFTLSVGSNLSKEFYATKSFTSTVVLRN